MRGQIFFVVLFFLALCFTTADISPDIKVIFTENIANFRGTSGIASIADLGFGTTPNEELATSAHLFLIYQNLVSIIRFSSLGTGG